MFPIEISNIQAYKDNGIACDMIAFGARTPASSVHTITADEASSWLFDVECVNAAAGQELMTNWDYEQGFIMKPDADVVPKNIQRGYCLFVWSAQVITSSATGNRFVRPFYLNRSDNSINYQNMQIMSTAAVSSRENLSGSCIAPLVWDNDGYCTPAIGFNLKTGDEITSASFAAIIFVMS